MRTLLAATMLISASTSFFGQDGSVVHRFDYAQKAPLDIKEVGIEHRGDIEILDISYASRKGGRVPAYLVVPKGKGPFAGVIWGHWYWENSAFRNRKEFLDEAVVLAGNGVMSLLTDGPIARPGHVENQEPLNEQQITDLIQQIVDMRRGTDLLLVRKDLDPTRLAYVGHSYNATVGGFLSGIDKRFKAFVLMAGGLSNDSDFKSQEYQKYRQKVGAEKFDAFAAKYAWLDPGKFVSHAAPAEVFLQYASQEKFLNPERKRKCPSSLTRPLNAEARRDRIAFLAEKLQFKPPQTALVASIPDLVQPPEPAP